MVFDLKINELKTDYGIIRDCKSIDNKPLILCEPAGYITSHEGKESDIRENSKFLILDISGSIGKNYVKNFNADIIICSFGEHKPLDVGHGGFFATNDKKIYYAAKDLFEAFKVQDFEKEVLDKLNNLDKKYENYERIKKRIVQDLQKEKIQLVYGGINVFAKFKNKDQQRLIERYLDKHSIPYLMCPKYHRVNEEGISIEIKRM